MIGLRHCASRSQPLVMKSLVNTSMKSRSFISLMSAPAAKARSLPVTTMAPILASASRSFSACSSSAINWAHSAFSALGRLRVIRPTRSRFSSRMVSNLIAAGFRR